MYLVAIVRDTFLRLVAHGKTESNSRKNRQGTETETETRPLCQLDLFIMGGNNNVM